MHAHVNVNLPQEIVLHSLFESGVSRIQGLERYITDDIVRHGNRLNDLEKKIVNVYQEFTSTEAIDDDALFANEDDEEEESAFVMYVLLLNLSLYIAYTVGRQGPVHRRHWRGLSRPARARNRFRVWSFVSLHPETSPQGQEKRQAKCDVRFFHSPCHLLLTRAPS